MRYRTRDPADYLFAYKFCLCCRSALVQKTGRGRRKMFCSNTCSQRFRRAEQWMREGAPAHERRGGKRRTS